MSKHGGHAYPGMEKVYDMEAATNGMSAAVPPHKMRDSDDDSNKGASSDLQLRVSCFWAWCHVAECACMATWPGLRCSPQHCGRV